MALSVCPFSLYKTSYSLILPQRQCTTILPESITVSGLQPVITWSLCGLHFYSLRFHYILLFFCFFFCAAFHAPPASYLYTSKPSAPLLSATVFGNLCNSASSTFLFHHFILCSSTLPLAWLCVALQGRTCSWRQWLTSRHSTKARTSPSIRRCTRTSPAPLTPTISSLSSTPSPMSSSPTTCASVVFTEPRPSLRSRIHPLFCSPCLALQQKTTEWQLTEELSPQSCASGWARFKD